MWKMLISLLLLSFTTPGWAEKPDDAAALAGLETAKVIFDINVPAKKPEKLLLYLKVIQETHDDFVRQNVKPKIILAFRGSAVNLITENPKVEGDAGTLMEIAALIEQFQTQDMLIEACGVAMRLSNLSADSLLPGVKMVGNTFVSLTGYHAQGYAIIPIY